MQSLRATFICFCASGKGHWWSILSRAAKAGAVERQECAWVSQSPSSSRISLYCCKRDRLACLSPGCEPS